MILAGGDWHRRCVQRLPVRARRLAGVERLRGGTNKGVYRLTRRRDLRDRLCLGRRRKTTGPAPAPDASAGPFADASGAGLFEGRARRADRARRAHAAGVPHGPQPLGRPGGACAVVRRRRERHPAGRWLARLAAALELPLRARRDRRRKCTLLSPGRRPRAPAAPQRTLRAGRAGPGAGSPGPGGRPGSSGSPPPAPGCRGRRANWPPRCGPDRPRLIHGARARPRPDRRPRAAGPDRHRGAMFFDLEWEHVFLELRFGEHYRALRAGRPG